MTYLFLTSVPGEKVLQLSLVFFFFEKVLSLVFSHAVLTNFFQPLTRSSWTCH